MNKTLPRISVIMPVLNRGDMIEKAIASVLNQNYPHFELIILDGGSRDNTVDIIKQYEKHITYWHSQYDGSVALATNMGIEKASGDLVALLMADDYYEPGLFHRIAEASLANPCADIFTCIGRMVSIDAITQLPKILEKYESEKALQLNFYNICYGITGICFRFIKKSLHERIGVYIPFHADHKQMLTNDKEFLLRATLHGVNHVFVNHLGYTHVAHEGSYSFGNHRSTFLRHCMEHMDIAREYLMKSELSLRQRLFLKTWYNDQAVKLFLIQLRDCNFRAAMRTFMQAMRTHSLLWPVMFVVTSCRAVIKLSSRNQK